MVSFFDDGSYVKATYVDGKQVNRTESSSATVTTPTEEIVLTNEAPPPEDDNSGQDVKISGDPSDPDSYNDSKISGVISAALAELMALQFLVHEIRRGGAVDPGREDGAASARGTLIIAPDKLRGLLVGGDGRGADNSGPYNSVVPPVLRRRDPGNVDPSPDQQ